MCKTYVPAWIFVLLVLLVPMAGYGAVGISITAGGAWTLNLNVTNLSGGGGSDFTMPQQSPTNQVTLRITGAAGLAWHVVVDKTDTTWDSSLHLWVKRTANGTGTGTITGGTTYLEVTGAAQTFFSGTLNRQLITIQLQFTGASVTLGANSFVTTVRYTVSSP